MKKKTIITIISIFISSASTILIPIISLINISKNNNQTNNENNNPNVPSKPTIPLKPLEPSKPIEPPTPPPGIDTTYFKNTVKLIDNPNQYSMAVPGTGIGENSIIPSSSGPTRTAPSQGIAEDAPINKTYLFNDNDIKQAKRSVSLAFYNGVYNMGTGWILDYKLTDDGSYPLTWYFGTNAHVIQNLKVKGDVISPERYEERSEDGYNTSQLVIRGIDNPSKERKYSNSEDDPNAFYSIPIIPKYDEIKKTTTNLKTIFIGNDYLKTSPGMFSNSASWKDSEEYIDFAVLEITFNSQDEARKATHEYANLNYTEQFKYERESLLKNQNALIENGYKVLGFPNVVSSNGDPWTNTFTIQMFTSVPESPNQQEKAKGTNLASSGYYNSFKNKKGVFDAALVLSFFGYNYRMAKQETKFYNSWGLAYPVDYGKLGKGSSGSMLMDENGYTVGIHFAGDDRASMGLAQALYCEGFSYNKAYGSYNLEGYDLIQGGFPNQKKSYLDGLKQLYGQEQNFKTNLFPNGLNNGIRNFE